ncbi:carbohydrate ABC transporter substrate-binding protein [Streptomyces kasugaensis]|uniref:Carbohydrate ABC transporter substrate-binding protein n=2 Tax=Streptomyces TaxID=1883 RepID=A0A4Q9HQI9_STRKA|nr:ABC transporter substrate-binding protein [Streptomyces kasugaensis]TBO56985.1 carbohydrate ABC transporter substrate-binding protein [Streptomyces kasugaensis]WSK11167.1 ABC transporter substrate-binding protein [Streptomyces celluloflavus]
MSRRTLLRGAALGAGAVALPSLLAACDSGPSGVSLGSNASDAVPKKAFAAAFAAYEKKSKKTVKVNTVNHENFQENINRYLQGTPDDVFMWFAGNRMQYFAQKGLLADISDLWQHFGGFSDALKKQSTGADGKQYFVPYYYYPWAVFHRKSVFQEKGYEIPKTFDEYRALAKRMQRDGLVPFAFGDKDGWPAMGTFDYLDMRANGYDFHIALLSGRKSWNSPQVKQVFDLWRGLLPYHQKGANGRTWQEAAQSLAQKKAGMTVLGLPHPGQQFAAADRDDLDFFPFPEIDSAFGRDAVEAPVDGFLMSKKARDKSGARELLTYLATPAAEDIYLASDPNNIAVNSGADTSAYTPLQKKAVQLVSGARQISQFMDRDTRPDFASTVLIQAIQQFLNRPDDIDGLVNDIERQKKQIFAAG